MYISSFPRYYHFEIIVGEVLKFLQKCFDLISFSSQKGYFNEYERFCNFKQTSWNYKTFISTFFTLLKFINNTFNETQWLISLHKLLFYQRDIFVKIWRYSFETMKIVFHHRLYFVYSILEFWWSMVKVVLCFSNKCWIYR